MPSPEEAAWLCPGCESPEERGIQGDMREPGPVWGYQPEGVPSTSQGHLVQKKSSKHLWGGHLKGQ